MQRSGLGCRSCGGGSSEGFAFTRGRPVDLLTATMAFLMATLVSTAVPGSSSAVTSLTCMYLLVLHPHGAPLPVPQVGDYSHTAVVLERGCDVRNQVVAIRAHLAPRK